MGNPAPVAQLLKENEVVLQIENNPPDYKYMITKLLYYIITTWGTLAPKQMEKLFLKIKKAGLLSPHTIAIYYFLLIHRAATRQTIAEQLETGEQTVYKNISTLEKNGNNNRNRYVNCFIVVYQ